MTDNTIQIPTPDNDERGWDIIIKEGEAWLVTSQDMTNLGPKEAAFARLAEILAADDFGERA